MDKNISELKKWLSKSNTRKLVLAQTLNYKTSNTIDRWLYNNSIPQHQVPRVLEIIRKKTK